MMLNLRLFAAYREKAKNYAFLQLLLLRLVFLFCFIVIGLNLGGILAFGVYLITAGTSGNGEPAIYTFVFTFLGCILFGLYTIIFTFSRPRL